MNFWYLLLVFRNKTFKIVPYIIKNINKINYAIWSLYNYLIWHMFKRYIVSYHTLLPIPKIWPRVTTFFVASQCPVHHKISCPIFHTESFIYSSVLNAIFIWLPYVIEHLRDKIIRKTLAHWVFIKKTLSRHFWREPEHIERGFEMMSHTSYKLWECYT